MLAYKCLPFLDLPLSLAQGIRSGNSVVLASGEVGFSWWAVFAGSSTWIFSFKKNNLKTPCGLVAIGRDRDHVGKNVGDEQLHLDW